MGRDRCHSAGGDPVRAMGNNYGRLLEGRLADPYPVYAQLRTDDPVHWSEPVASWILTRHRDVAAVLQYDPRITAERLSRLMSQLPKSTSEALRPLNDHLRTFVQFYDPPDHSRLRATAAPSFTPRAVERLRPLVQSVVDDFLVRAEQSDHVDLIGDFAYPLPATVIAEVLGIPPSERARFKVWADRIAEFFEGVGEHWAEAAEEANRAVLEMEAFIGEQVRQRRLQPKEDVLTRLLTEVDGERLTQAELFGWCMFLLLAGHETTTGLIGNAVVALLEHPDSLAELRGDPTLFPLAIEELLRYDSPIQRISRVSLASVELDGGTIAAGARIWAMIGAANRDPEQFDHPDRLDLRRDPNRHLAFGYGVHFCLGASLARLEGQLAVESLISRYPDLRLAGPAPRRQGVSLHQYQRIPIALR